MAARRVKRGRPRVLSLATPGPDPEGMDTRAAEHIDWMRVRNYSRDTVRDRMHCLSYFERWCAERGITRPREVTRPILERYQRWLFLYRKRGRGAPLLRDAARPPHRRPGLLPVARPAEPHPLQPRLRPRAAQGPAAPSARRAHDRRGREGPRAARHRRSDRRARPRDPRDLLLDGHAAEGAQWPRRLRPRRRARHAAGPRGQGAEGPHRPDRRAGARLDREVPPRGAPELRRGARPWQPLPRPIRRAFGAGLAHLSREPVRAARRASASRARATSSGTPWRR